ncbi:hypothetical protein MNBD_BACTEROID01-1603 [hydrothermal vent metagenome]|uniref:NodB homology domain-containing protein n=1 Tax=hydrothermal vent metagenome TaxID=652676 RepID=A0A3B0UI43_9ZZZZ
MVINKTKEEVRKIVFKFIRLTGLPALSRRFIQKDKVSILLFHDISKETAEKSFDYLTGKYNIIGLYDFIKACEKRDQSMLPKKAMIITLDDGVKRNFELLPVFKKYKIPVTLFLCSSIINTKRHFWFNYSQPGISVTKLKYKTNKEKLEILAKYGFEQKKEYDTPQALTKRQVDKMKGIVNMESHTRFHPCLPKCKPAEAKKEIIESKKILEKEFNLGINAISYPNGDYSEREIAYSKEAGYKCGLTVDFGFNSIKSDLFRLKRLCVNDADDINELIVKASGVWDFFKTLNGKRQKFGWTDNIVQ